MMKSKIFSVFLLSLLFMACSESAESLISNNKEKANSQFDQFYKCFEIAQAIPVISKDEIIWEQDDANTKYREANVYQIGFESFKDLALPLDVPFDGSRRLEHADMAKLFNVDLSTYQLKHNYEVDADYSYHKIESGESCRNAIQHFLDVKYLLINRVYLKSEPKIVDGESYIMGHAEGDVLVFDVAAAKLLGGFIISVDSDDSISLKESSDFKANLDAGLSSKVYNVIKQKMAELTPSITTISFDF